VEEMGKYYETMKSKSHPSGAIRYVTYQPKWGVGSFTSTSQSGCICYNYTSGYEFKKDRRQREIDVEINYAIDFIETKLSQTEDNVFNRFQRRFLQQILAMLGSKFISFLAKIIKKYQEFQKRQLDKGKSKTAKWDEPKQNRSTKSKQMHHFTIPKRKTNKSIRGNHNGRNHVRRDTPMGRKNR